MGNDYVDGLRARINELRGALDHRTLVNGDLSRKLGVALERAVLAERERDEERAENQCDACGGTGKPASGKPCMCRGTGKMSVSALTLRDELVEARAKVAKLEAEIRQWAEQRGEHDAAMEQIAKALGASGNDWNVVEAARETAEEWNRARARRAKEK